MSSRALRRAAALALAGLALAGCGDEVDEEADQLRQEAEERTERLQREADRLERDARERREELRREAEDLELELEDRLP